MMTPAHRTEKQLTRVPPQAIDAERAVLGSMLIDPDAVQEGLNVVKEAYFYREAHRKIFRVIAELHARGDPVDLVTVTETLRVHDWLDEVGGAYEISQLAEAVVSAAHLHAYARQVSAAAAGRLFINTFSGLITNTYQGEDITQTADHAEDALRKIRGVHDGMDTVFELESLDDLSDSVIDLVEHPDKLLGDSTHISDLDPIFQMHRQRLVVIAGYPGHGKSSLGLTLIMNSALQDRIPGAIFSLETGKTVLALMLLSMLSRVELLGRGKTKERFTGLEMTQLSKALPAFTEAPVYISDTVWLTLNDLRRKIREYAKDFGVKNVLVDYAQLMKVEEDLSQREKYEEISGGLKAIAKEQDVTMLAILQLSKPKDGNTSRVPILDQLKGTGKWEADADVVIFVHNWEKAGVREITLFGKPWTVRGGETVVRVAKNKTGPIGERTLQFTKPFFHFGNLDYRRRGVE